MKKKFAPSFVALVSVALLAACGEAQVRSVKHNWKSSRRKQLKSVLTLKRQVLLQLTVQLNKGAQLL